MPKDPSRDALTKDDEIAVADAADAAQVERIRKLDLSTAEKRAILSERLTPRLSLETA